MLFEKIIHLLQVPCCFSQLFQILPDLGLYLYASTSTSTCLPTHYKMNCHSWMFLPFHMLRKEFFQVKKLTSETGTNQQISTTTSAKILLIVVLLFHVQFSDFLPSQHCCPFLMVSACLILLQYVYSTVMMAPFSWLIQVRSMSAVVFSEFLVSIHCNDAEALVVHVQNCHHIEV